MKTEKVPFLKNKDVLIVPLNGDLSDSEISNFETRLLAHCAKNQKIRAVLIDVSSLESVDLYTGRVLTELARKLELMDLKPVVVGLKPEVAMTMVEMGQRLSNVRTAINIEQCMHVLSRDKDR